MKKFVFLYYGSADMSPESAAAWGAWFHSIEGSLVDGGNPFGEGRLVTSDGTTELSAAMKPATGYSIVSAESIDAAQKLLDGCPADGGVQVYDAIPM